MHSVGMVDSRMLEAQRQALVIAKLTCQLVDPQRAMRDAERTSWERDQQVGRWGCSRIAVSFVLGMGMNMNANLKNPSVCVQVPVAR